jgi:hypothetical protein
MLTTWLTETPFIRVVAMADVYALFWFYNTNKFDLMNRGRH